MSGLLINDWNYIMDEKEKVLTKSYNSQRVKAFSRESLSHQYKYSVNFFFPLYIPPFTTYYVFI